MNFERIYEYRFAGVDRSAKSMTWNLIAHWVSDQLGDPQRVLDPAAGDCEFINHCPAPERWAIDMSPNVKLAAVEGVSVHVGNNLDVDLPESYFDAVFVSNFLEHLDTQKDVAHFLSRMHLALRPSGAIVIMGPNFRLCAKHYFDFADHTVALSDRSIAEHLHGAGFEVLRVEPRFLPLSFRGRLPVTDALVRAYLAHPIFWRLFGKQFFVIARA